MWQRMTDALASPVVANSSFTSRSVARAMWLLCGMLLLLLVARILWWVREPDHSLPGLWMLYGAGFGVGWVVLAAGLGKWLKRPA
jgi:hypothetical protein